MKKINLSIPKPCHENWDGMTPSDKGRFCASCQKTVTDFTNMSDRQIAEFFKKTSGSVCGRFYQDQLNRDVEIPKKRIPWLKYFFQFSLPALLVSLKATAQGKVRMTGDTVDCAKSPTVGTTAIVVPDKQIDEHSFVLHGSVVDDRGYTVSFATVAIKKSTLAVKADKNGMFTIKCAFPTTLVVSAVGFEQKEVSVQSAEQVRIQLAIVVGGYVVQTKKPVKTSRTKTASVDLPPGICKSTDSLTKPELNLEPVNDLRPKEQIWRGTVGAVVFVRETSKPSKRIPVISNLIDTAFKKFSVYPNPVQRNSTMKIDLKKLEAGDYTISIINMAGEVIQTEEVSIQKKKEVVDLHLEETAAGTYFIHVFNRKTAASYSEKIVVQ